VSAVVRVDLGGLSFDVAVGGPEGGRGVLLLHGFPENARMWDAVLPPLHAAGLRTAAPDQRGYSPGARPADVEAYAMRELVGDVTGLLDALGWAAVDLVGHDWGAAVAGRHPDRVRTLTTVSVPHPLALSEARQADDEQRQRLGYIHLFRTADAAEEALLAEGMRRLRRMLQPMPPERVEVFVGPMAAPGALTAALNWYRAATRQDADLGSVPAPTTYVWGTDDLAIARSAAERCGEHVSGPYRFVELPDVSHWIPELQPEAIADAVLDRIGSVPVAR
jgi:pimeloyl-ACP methyl ester carboxylesterase